MLNTWYEKDVDAEGYLLFVRRKVYHGWKTVNPFPHFHNGVQFAIGLVGDFDITINGTLYTVHEGEICFMNTFDLKQYHFRNGTECYIVLISSGYFNEVNGLADLAFPHFMPKNENFRILRAYLENMEKIWDKDSLLLKTAFADMMIWLMKKYYPVIPKKPIDKESELPLKTIKYICEHLTEDLSVSSLAKKFGYSPNYFSTLFNRFTGMNFREYVNACRIVEYKKIKKQSPALSTVAAAQLAGFTSMNSFYRAWKASSDS